MAAAAPQAAADAAALPFLGDDIFVLIAGELDARVLGRLRPCSLSSPPSPWPCEA